MKPTITITTTRAGSQYTATAYLSGQLICASTGASQPAAEADALSTAQAWLLTLIAQELPAALPEARAALQVGLQYYGGPISMLTATLRARFSARATALA